MIQLGGSTVVQDDRDARAHTAEVELTTAELARHHADVARYLVRQGAAFDVAEDLASEAIIRLWLRMQDGLRPRSRTGYLFRIARNLLIDYVRQADRERMRAEALAVRAARQSSAAGDATDAIALTLVIDVARKQLPRRFQRVLVCTLDLGMSLAETAAALGLPSPGAAAVLAHRARRALVDALVDLSA